MVAAAAPEQRKEHSVKLPRNELSTGQKKRKERKERKNLAEMKGNERRRRLLAT